MTKINKLGAVLPLCIRGSYDIDDLGRVEILFRSLTAFSAPGLFGTFLVVTPSDEVQIVRQRCEKWSHLGIEVISEEELIPELVNHRELRGWRKQQLVKIAAARRIKEEFFITFDADVICLKPISIDNLIIDGRALLQYEYRSQHPKWWKSSARILKMDADVGNVEYGMTVTPAILAKDLCNKLAEELSDKKYGSWVDKICALHKPKNPSNWTISRFLKSKWTEYSLYYLCAMKLQLLDQYHVTAGSADVPQLMLIHDSHPFENWDVAKSFSNKCPGLFCVVGSKSRLEPEVVWDKVKPFIPFE
ncbi:DUF6492 family protein [Agarilytica rhodophyticola]|uniref:DUF6492 family protein n=1 Tax=Agarilytica rhodophyticola TaxID=1737490 RepID=UPI000B34347E|nr:DUF6492 family protein [Agarilytica rhodophyticola]